MSDHDCANTQLYPVEQCHICQEREHYKFIESENTRLRAQLAEAREVIELFAKYGQGGKARAFLAKYSKSNK